MVQKKKYGRLAAVLLAGSLAVPVWAVDEEDLKEAESQKSIYEQEIQKAQDLIESLQNSKSDVADYIQQLDEGLGEITQNVKELQEQAELKKTEIEKTQEQLETAREDEEAQYEAMKLRIKYMYEAGESDYLEILFSSDSLTDLLNQAEYISQMTEYDRQMLEKYRQTVALVEETENGLLREQTELAELEAQEQGKMASMQVLYEEKTAELSGLEGELSDQEDKMEEYEQGLQQQNLTIEELERALKEEEERAIQLAEQASREAEEASIAASKSEAESIRQSEEAAAASSTAVPEQPEDPGNTESSSAAQPAEPSSESPSGGDYGSRGDGTFYLKWPCPSSRRITSVFGPRPDKPVEGAGEFHNGIDIGASTGSEIVAVADGIVTVAEYSVSGGNMVYISHENGKFMTLYHHMTHYIVSPGQAVKAGQVIGYVGNTGYSTGPHLDFRIINGGQHIDPLGSNITYEY